MSSILVDAVALGLLWSIMTIGVYLTYRILDVADLTVEGSIATGAAVAAHCMEIGTNPYLATFYALIAGMLAGFCTGVLHTKLKIPALLSGILSMIALYSVNLRIMGKSNVSLLKCETVYSLLPIKMEKGIQFLGSTISAKTIQILVIGIICVVLVCVAVYTFFGTELGCAIRATGSNDRMARAQGINTNAMIIIGLVLSNGLVALSGALIAQNQSFADVQMGTGSIVIGLASLIIGEVIFGTRTFKHTLCSIVGGAVIYRVIIALVLKMGMNANDLKLFTAITVAICLSLPIFKDYFATLKKSAKGGNTANA